MRDRIVQTAVLLILESIFEADFLDTSYGFRPERSAQDAIAAIQGHLQAVFAKSTMRTERLFRYDPT